MIFALALIPLKAFFPTFVKAVPFTVIFVNLPHFSKADVPIVFTFFPMVTLVTFLPFKALFAIEVTLNFFPPIFTSAGIVTFLVVFFFKPAKAASLAYYLWCLVFCFCCLH